MVDEQTRHRAIAASAATITAFIGFCHEVIGTTLFPWGPAAIGGAVPWHLLGAVAISAGLVLLLGTLHLISAPLVPVARFVTVLGVAVAVFVAFRTGEIHVLALVFAASGVVFAIEHGRAEAALARGGHPSP
jgi:hypothetical protein